MDFLEFLFDIVKPWIAATIISIVGLILGIVGIVWHSSEAAKVAACESAQGRFGQVFNTAAQVDCGSSSLLAKIAIAVAVVGFILLGLALIGLATLAGTGKLHDLEA